MYEANILLVDDETAILQLLTTILEKEGFSHITTATSAEMALSLTQQNDYDLIILDVMLPGQSGFDICPIIRQKTDCPIFFLTAKTADLDKISGFSHGADDYITKPFNPLEVVARMKAQLRRHMKQVMPHEQKAHSSSFGRFEIDRYSAELTVNGRVVDFGYYSSFTRIRSTYFQKKKYTRKFGEHLPTMAMTIPLWSTFENYVKKSNKTQVNQNI